MIHSEAIQRPIISKTHALHTRSSTSREDILGQLIDFDGDIQMTLKAPNFVTHLDYDWRSEIWQPIYEEISQLGMLVRFDQRGNGLSERNPENISFSSMVEDISAVVENEKLENFVLFGVSQGAASAIKFASDNPDIVSGLVLLGGFSRGLSRRGDGQEGKIMLETQMIRSGWENENPAFRQYFTTTMIDRKSVV